MENSNNSEIKQKYKRISSNRPIYKYKPISYYSNEIKKEESNSSGEEEEEFSYSINDKKLEALKQKKRKIVENKDEDVKAIKLPKSESNKNNFKNKNETPNKKKIIKKKKVKKIKKNPTNFFEKKEEEKEKNEIKEIKEVEKKEEINEVKEVQEKKDEIKEVKEEEKKEEIKDVKEEEKKEEEKIIYETAPPTAPKEEKIIKTKSLNDLGKKEDSELEKSEKILLDEAKNRRNSLDFFNFEVDEDDYKNENNNVNFIFDLTKKSKKLSKKIKVVKARKNNNSERNKSQKKDKSKDNNINKDINENNNIENKDNEKSLSNKKDKNEKNESLNIEKFIVKIQSIWRIYQSKKKAKFFNKVLGFTNKISEVMNNKFKDNYNCFINKIKSLKKRSNIKTKNQKKQKKIDKEKIKELIEKEKKYEVLMIKYEEVLKELEKLKNELINKKTIFNQNLNLINNKNQNISINIFPEPQNKKRSEKFEKTNDILISDFSENRIKNSLIINKIINIKLLNSKENDSNIDKAKKKNKLLKKIINDKDNKNKFYLYKSLYKYKMNVDLLKNTQIIRESNIINKEKTNIIINKVKSFSIFNNDAKNTKLLNNIIFKESKLIINKNISNFIKRNNTNSINNNYFVINKINNEFIFNKKKKKDFIIVKQIKYNILNNKCKNTQNIFQNLTSRNESNSSIEVKLINKKILSISESCKMEIMSYKKINNNNFVIHKIINKIIIDNPNKCENKAIDFNQNLDKANLYLLKNNLRSKDLFINKIINLHIIKKRMKKENIIHKQKSIKIIGNLNNNIEHKFIISKINDKFIRGKTINNTKNNHIITKVINNCNILNLNKNKNIFKSNNLIINKVINDKIIDKLKVIKEINKTDDIKFNENKLVINKINKLFIHKIKKSEYVINKSIDNNIVFYKNKDKSIEKYIIAKVNKLNIKSSCKKNILVINKTNCNYNITGEKEKPKNIFDGLVINKIINNSNISNIKKKEGIINRIISKSIVSETIINNNKNNNLNKVNYNKNLIITKIINKFEIKSLNKTKSAFLFIEDNNQLFIKRNKINKNKKKKKNKVEEAVKDIINEEVEEENNSIIAHKKKKKAKKFKNSQLFIDDNNQLKIKGIKNKK